MADKPASERTEQPTPDRLRKARREGRVAISSEVPSALAVGLLLIVLALTGPLLLGRLARSLRGGVSFRLPAAAEGEAIAHALRRTGGEALTLLVPFLLAGAASSVFAGLVVGGWACAPSLASPKFERISPANGLKNLFSLRSLARLLASLVKLGVVLAIVYFYLHGRLDRCLALKWATPAGELAGIARLVFGLLARIAVALLAVALADALFQRWKHRRELRMTRQEVKEEIKEHELAPHTRGRMRTVQMSLARKRMLKEVPAADVVVTNPTHVAVALKYDARAMDAPTVVAKGADLLAEKIRQIAREHGVAVVQRPQLARTLYETVDLGEMVPETLFVAVAEVLAMIYRLRRRRLSGEGYPTRP